MEIFIDTNFGDFIVLWTYYQTLQSAIEILFIVL